jgi:site-specific DNA recombinase
MNTDSLVNNQIGKKAVIYIRVSSEEQVENFSLKTQEEICRRDAKYKGYEVVEVFREEGKSAKTILGRPELLKLLDYCRKNKKEVRAVFVYRLDRLSRQTSDFLALRQRFYGMGISLISASEPTGNSPTEKLLETVLASFAQHDNDVRSERTKNGMRARFLMGLVTNHVPLGYINQGGYALKDPKTFDLYKKAWDLMATGTKSLREMKDLMREWGLPIAGAQTVHHMFRNKFYMGVLTSKMYPEEVKGQHTPMVTQEQFYKVQAVLDGRNNNPAKMPKYTRDHSDFPLRRIVCCSKCGTPFTGAWSKFHKYAYYFCRKRCIYVSVPVKDLHQDLLRVLEEVKPTEKGVELYCAYLQKAYHKQIARLRKKSKSADEEISKLQALRQTLVEKNLAGIYSDEIFKEQNSFIEQKLIAAHEAKDQELIDKYDINKITAFVEDKLSNLAETYTETEELSQIRSLLSTIFTSGFNWSYPGISYHTISPLYQEIRDADKPGVQNGCWTRIRTYSILPSWQETFIMTHHQHRLELLRSLQNNRDDNQQTGTAHHQGSDTSRLL